MKKIIPSLLCLFLFSPLGQEARGGGVDSLQHLLQQDIADTIRVKILNKMASELCTNNPDTAILLTHQALKLAKTTGFDHGKAKSLHLLGKFHWLKGENALAMDYYLKAQSVLKIIEQNKGPSLRVQKEKAITLGNMGIIYYVRGNYEKALQYYLKVLKMKKKVDDKKGQAQTLNNIGLLYHKTAQYPEALKYYRQSLQLKKEQNDKAGQAITLGNMGLIYASQGNYPQALDYYFKSLNMLEKIGDKRSQASTLNNVGIIYKKQGDLNKALQYYRKALRLAKEVEYKKSIANTLGNISTVYRAQKNYSKAFEYRFKALKTAQAMENKHITSVQLTNIGELYLTVYNDDSFQLNKFSREGQASFSSHALLDSAKVFQKRAYSLKKEIGDQEGIIHCLLNIGNIVNLEGSPHESMTYYRKAYEIADSIDALLHKKIAAQQIYKTYKAMNDPKRALQWHEKYFNLKDSLFNEEKQQELGRLEGRHKWQKKQLADSLQHAKEMRTQKLRHQHRMQQQETFTYVGVGGFVLMLALALTIFRSYRLKKRSNQELANKNKVINQQKQKVETKNKAVMDSITYAQYLQEAIFPAQKQLNRLLPDHFVLLRPLEKVSGDFYWAKQMDDKTFFCVADCTGHGVPAAMVSVVGNEALNRCLREFKLRQPAQILEKLSGLIEQHFEGSTQEVKDGMDIALCCWEPKQKQLTFAGANNPLYVVTNSKLTVEDSKIRTFPASGFQLYEFPPDSQPIGKQAEKQPFTDQRIQLNKGDTFYIFSDGYPDQFGGPKGKKFMYKRFRELLLDIQDKPMEEQKGVLNQTIEDWMAQNNEEQIDDICVLGGKV